MLPWLSMVGTSIGFALITALPGFLDPNDRPFSVRDATISFKFKHDTVHNALVISCWPIFAIIASAIEWKHHDRRNKKVFAVGLLLCSLFAAFATGFSFYMCTNALMGRPRPDFLDRCKPVVNTTVNTVPPTLYTRAVCTGDKSLIKKGFTSSPSGHTTQSFGIAAFSFMYFCWIFNSRYQPVDKSAVQDRRSYIHRECAEVGKYLCMLVPLFAAFWVGASRVHDNRHHVGDVALGVFAGTIPSVVTFSRATQYYNQYYHSL
eukprot:CAMPEP_0175143398 /NCGR_PEP_ID=MMETSP0087-20121206/13407_1 /TAXON_ID=136419 /ORGANISM="Unknown Unknown, Strain D1" /LENGTH=261 /DNA_ID=CAMNT_0016427457 /DNA_START=122 /DNA_END=907 /DNA_ORIENTATION=-